MFILLHKRLPYFTFETISNDFHTFETIFGLLFIAVIAADL